MADRGGAAIPADARRIAETLFKHRVEHIVIGGYAVVAHGYPRVTQDLDVVPRLRRENLAQLAVALGEMVPGFKPPGGGAPLDFGLGGFARYVTSHGVLNLVARPEGIPGGYEELLPGAIEVAVGDIRLRVAGRDELIRMKRALGRPQDLEDIAAIERG
jgi:hypothetical protein